jgi:3-deoxy-D-manno-octulosonic-acid transferase
MSLAEAAYTLCMRAVGAALPLLARARGKVGRGAAGRTAVLGEMRRWAEAERDPGRPLVWFHAPSVGEGLQAEAVMEIFRRLRPEAQIVYTFFSPSAEGLARRMPADFAGYLPVDSPAAVATALDLLQPALIVFSKTDAWPNLTREAKARGVRLAMVSATLPASSSRLGRPARSLLAAAYGRLDLVAAISQDDADRFAALHVPAERRVVMGDAHFDRVVRRATSVDRGSRLLALLGQHRPILVAGSTWGADEEHLIPAFAALQRAGSELRLVLVPHEPSADHLEGAEARLVRSGLAARRLAELDTEWPAGEVLLIDRVGVLGELYAVADMAFVGGGFGHDGLHSVLEPAAFGAPILFGPHHANAREAGDLLRVGGAREVRDENSLREGLRGWAGDPEACRAAGAAARAYVERGRGAAARGAELLSALLD